MSESHRIPFQFEDNLPHQAKAIKAVVDIFSGLTRAPSGIYKRVRKNLQDEPRRNIDIVTGSRLLENLQKVQIENNLFLDSSIHGNNFTVEMETGTGKTYVYLRTILELHKLYGFTKFMIVVPSIAIRKGVEKSISMLCDHFKPHYDGIDIVKRSFVYDSKKLQKVRTDFVQTDDLSICLINSQAFTSDSTLIRKKDEYDEVLWEDIKYVRPIVIIDEPQKIEGSAKKKSKTLEILESLNPLFSLRYSATHKQLCNQVYRLDSFDAFQEELVKKIEVKTVHGTIQKDFPYVRYVTFTPDLKARIEIFHRAQGSAVRFKTFDVVGGDSLHELSGNLSQYRDMRIFEDPHKSKPLKIAQKTGFLELNPGESNDDIQPDEAIRIQIRLTIEKHFEKQFAILDGGRQIKVLSLFFIDAVNKIRSEKGDGRGEYLQIFDEEYEKAVRKKRFQEKFKQYSELFPQHRETTAVREGYFARDAKNAVVDIEDWDPSKEDGKVKKKSQEDIDRGIELILEKKDELISFKEPLAFIFSHSALREGWDNPNVFVLCTLKGRGSEIAKKQEIGRGLRLPVNTEGNRCLDPQINELTVIANDYYDHFAENLQRDFNENMGFHKDEVTHEILLVTLKEAGLPVEKIGPELINSFREELLAKGFLNAKNLLTGEAENIESTTFEHPDLQEHAVKIKESFIKAMRDKGTRKIPVKNGDNPDFENGVHDYVHEGVFAEIFKKLSENLLKRAIYKSRLNKDKFIHGCTEELNEFLGGLQIRREYSVETGKQTLDKKGRRIEMGSAVSTKEVVDLEPEMVARSEFEMVNELMYHSMLPRLAILRILRGLDKPELLADQDVFDAVVKRVLRRLQDAKARTVYEYEVISGYEFDEKTIFEMDVIDEEMLQKVKRVYQTKAASRRAVNKFYRTDSDGEYDFAQSLESDPGVLLFTKLKKGGFLIETPYGSYSPDWGVVYRGEDEITKLYFVVETKIDKEEHDLTEEEKFKIKCGELHFQAVSDLIECFWANSYADFLGKKNIREKKRKSK